MVDAFIYDHVRTPRGRGKPDGSLHTASTLQLAATALKAIKDRNRLEEDQVDDVVMGCVDPIGEAGGDIARMGALAAGLGEAVPGVQINRFCASGLDSVNFASAQVMSGQHELTIGGGVESMSRVGIGASGGAWPADPSLAIPTYFMPQGISADLIATKYGFSRDDVDAYAVEFAEARSGGLERGPVQELDRPGPRRQRPHDARPMTSTCGRARTCSRSLRSSLHSSFPASKAASTRSPSRRIRMSSASSMSITPAIRRASSTAPPPCSLARARPAQKRALKPRARVRAFANIGSEPAIMLTGPIDVTKKVLARSGMSLSDIDLFEINEAFASVVLRFRQAFDLDASTVNVNGGAIAMGHPLGATGAMILGTALDELERTGKSTALITLCIGGGMGTATIIERV